MQRRGSVLTLDDVKCQASVAQRAMIAPKVTVKANTPAGRQSVVETARRVIAEHPRHGRERIVIDPCHYEGEATNTVLPPVPLGRMGRRLQELMALTPQQRPLDLYAALAEVAR